MSAIYLMNRILISDKMATARGAVLKNVTLEN